MWDDHWETKLRSRLTATGFSSVGDLLKSRPLAALAEFSTELECAEVQLGEFYLRETAAAGSSLRRRVQDLLFRRIRHRFPGGWISELELDRALVYSETVLLMRRVPEAASAIPALERVWSELRSLELEGWLPEDASDPRLERAFQAWASAI